MKFTLQVLPMMAADILDVPPGFELLAVEIDRKAAKAILSLHRKLSLVEGATFLGAMSPAKIMWHGVVREPSQATCEEVVITRAGVSWTCFPKHGSMAVQSREIPMDTIKKIARAKVPRRRGNGR